jgi:hypothetical protein
MTLSRQDRDYLTVKNTSGYDTLRVEIRGYSRSPAAALCKKQGRFLGDVDLGPRSPSMGSSKSHCIVVFGRSRGFCGRNLHFCCPGSRLSANREDDKLCELAKVRADKDVLRSADVVAVTSDV